MQRIEKEKERERKEQEENEIGPSVQKVKPPFLTQNNNLKNDPSLVKALAKQSYEESLALHVRTGKMTEARREELLAKITKVASNDLTVYEGIESDIKVSKNDQNGNIVIDMVVH